MEHKEPIKVSGKTIGATLIGFVGALMLGIGMCLTMVWSSMIVGIIVGLIGIVVLLCLIPFAKGLRINGKNQGESVEEARARLEKSHKKQKSRMREISQVSDRTWEISFGFRRLRSQFGHNLKTKRK